MAEIWNRVVEDRIALSIALGLVVAQLGIWFRLRVAGWRALTIGGRAIRAAVAEVARAVSPSDVKKDRVPQAVIAGIRAAYPADSELEAIEPAVAFGSEHLLPRDYNGRLDSAAPGLFTAMGIIGTFLGLIVSFFRIDFAQPAESIKPLVGGMLAAFLNSLVGVTLSIVWTYRARVARHQFDLASTDLRLTVEERFGARTHGSQVLSALARIGSGISTLRSDVAQLASSQRDGTLTLSKDIRDLSVVTGSASQDLLNSLAPRLEETFKALVDTPFERLNESAESFRATLERAAESHHATLDKLALATGALAEAKLGLAEAAGTVEASVETFRQTTVSLQQDAEAAASMVASTQRAAESLKSTTQSFESLSARQGQLASALGSAVTELRGTSGALDGVAQTFVSSAERLDHAVARIGEAGSEAAEASVRTLHDELERGVRRMSEALAEFGARNVQAYEQSTARVIGTVDERTTDLTDRLSAELATLATRLPDSAAEIARSVHVMRKQLSEAVGKLEQSARTLDAHTSQTLAARLKEYDETIAKAVDHFSGTLHLWDGKVTELGVAAREIRGGVKEVVAAMTRRRSRDLPPGNDPHVVSGPHVLPPVA